MDELGVTGKKEKNLLRVEGACTIYGPRGGWP